MATRIGIELSPDACRIVEIDPAPAWDRRRGSTRVRSFAVLPPSGPETDAKLQSLRNRRVAVVVWNAASDHRQILVSPGSYESMRAEAIGALEDDGVDTRGVFVDIAPATRTKDRAARQPVVVALASGTELTAALQPLQAAGIRVRTVMTPAAALSSLARLRREFWTPDALEVFVALEERVTCIALMRSGALIASRDLAWGYIDEFGTGLQPRGREDIATRLVDAINQFVAATGGAPGDLKHICVSGGHPELRSVTAPVMEQLDVEFEPLDSLFGIDAAQLPEPVDEFRERGAELRLAWAAAADSPPTINLLRARSRRASKTLLARAALLAGVAALLIAGWRVQGRLWRPAAPNVNARTAAEVSPTPRREAPASTVTVTKMPVVRPPPAAAATAPPVVLPPQPPQVETPPTIAPPPIVQRTEPRQPSAVTRPPVGATVRETPARIGQQPARLRARPAPPRETAPPFEAKLGGILISPDRKLAIIDGRIVAPGDEVRGARIIAITSSTVTLRDGEGRLRKLTMNSKER